MGGNAANTAVVLAQLGLSVDWVGNLPLETPLIAGTFASYSVGVDLATPVAGEPAPTSYITLSHATGSRTIVHHRSMPEYLAADFERIDLSPFDWVRAPYRLMQAVSQYKGTLVWLPNFAYLYLANRIDDADLAALEGEIEAAGEDLAGAVLALRSSRVAGAQKVARRAMDLIRPLALPELTLAFTVEPDADDAGLGIGRALFEDPPSQGLSGHEPDDENRVLGILNVVA